MKIHYHIQSQIVACSAITIGFFDGVHLGHQKLLTKLKQTAQSIDAETVVITFSTHPRIVMKNEEEKLWLINTLSEKIELLEKQNIDHLIILEFTPEFAQIPAYQFLTDLLISKLNMKHILVGDNHRFGNKGEGNYEFLLQNAAICSYTVDKMDTTQQNNERISSTLIRNLFIESNILKINQILGYSFFITGKVVYGKQIGRTIGFPTANIEISDNYKIVPPTGVYDVDVEIDNTIYKGMLNIGFRPTISHFEKRQSIEVHVIDFQENIYDKIIRVFFLKKLRDEIKFSSKEQLIQQLLFDKQMVTSRV